MKQLVAAVAALIAAAVLICLSIWLPWDEEPEPLIPESESSSQEAESPDPGRETEDDRGVNLLQKWKNWETMAQQDLQYVWCADGRVVNLSTFSAFVEDYAAGREASCIVLRLQNDLPVTYQLAAQEDGTIRAVSHALTAGGGVQKAILTFDGIFDRESAYILQGYDGSLVIPKQAAPQWELMEEYDGTTTLEAGGFTPQDALEKAVQVDSWLEVYLDDNWCHGRENALEPMGTAIPDGVTLSAEESGREGEVTGAARIGGKLYYQVSLEKSALLDAAVYYVQASQGEKVYRLWEEETLTLVWDPSQKYYTR